VVKEAKCPGVAGGPFAVTSNVTNFGPKAASLFGVLPTLAGLSFREAQYLRQHEHYPQST